MSEEALREVTSRIAGGESPRRAIVSLALEMARDLLHELSSQGLVGSVRKRDAQRSLSAVADPEQIDTLPPILADTARDILAAMAELWDFSHMPSASATHDLVAAYVQAAQDGLGVTYAHTSSANVNRAALTHVSYEVADGAAPTQALASVLGAIMCGCIAATHLTWEGHDDLFLPKSSQLCAALHESTLEESLSLDDVHIVRDVALLIHDPQAALGAVDATDAWQATSHGLCRHRLRKGRIAIQNMRTI